MIKKIEYNGLILAIIIPADFHSEGICFFTPDSFSQQLGYMNRPEGHVILPHDHNPVPRSIEWTQEVLFVRSGAVRLDLYAPETRDYLESHILNTGDVVLLAHGGHGLVMREKAEIIEVKQGPYAGEQDKTRFDPVPDEKIILKN